MKKKMAALLAAMMLTSALTPVYADELPDITGLGGDVTLGLSLDEDELTKDATSWCEFKDGTLTLYGMLPDTGLNESLADRAGIKASSVKKVVIKPYTEAGSLSYAFDSMTSLMAIEGLGYLDTSSTESMVGMFYGCTSLKTVDMSGLNTSKVESMRDMFKECKALTSVNVSGINTSRVTNMMGMFESCESLKSLSLSSFNTTAVKDMTGMFSCCSSLKSLDLKNFSAASLEYANGMFGMCGSLTSLDLSNFYMSRFCTVNLMFIECTALGSLTLPRGFKVTDDMMLSNITGEYVGWAKAGTADIISGWEDEAEFTADTAGKYTHVKLPSPGITKIEPGNGKMNVTWEPVKGATSYKVYFKRLWDTDGKPLIPYPDEHKVITRTGTGAYIGGIENGGYEVYVKAIINGIESKEKKYTITMVMDYGIKCRTQQAGSGVIEISWDKFENAEGYRVVCIDRDNNVLGTKATNKCSFKWEGLKNGVTYGFYVQPRFRGGYPPFSRTDLKDSKYIVWTKPVNSPMITKLSLGNHKAWVYYESVPRAKKYYIYVSQDGKERLAGTTTNTKFLVTGLTNKDSKSTHEATFYVKALVDGKLTPLKRPAKRWTRGGIKPTVTPSSGKTVIKWTKYTENKGTAAKYKVILVDEYFKQIDCRETTNLSFTWKGLKKGWKYGFCVVPYVNGEYIPFGLTHADDKANVVMFTAR